MSSTERRGKEKIFSWSNGIQSGAVTPTKKHSRDPSWRPSRMLPAHHANRNDGSRSRTAPRHFIVLSLGDARAEQW